MFYISSAKSSEKLFVQFFSKQKAEALYVKN